MVPLTVSVITALVAEVNVRWSARIPDQVDRIESGLLLRMINTVNIKKTKPVYAN